MSDFHQYNNVATHAIPLVLSLFLGAWSDRRGRKLPLLLGLAGKLCYSTMIVINALQGKEKSICKVLQQFLYHTKNLFIVKQFRTTVPQGSQ